MSFTSLVKSRIAAVVTSQGLQATRRRVSEVKRRLSGQPHVVQYFHDVSDPYSHLTVQVLPELQRRYHIKLKPHLISDPPIQIVPVPEAHQRNAFIDAVRMAKRLGLVEPTVSSPRPAAITAAECRLAAELDDPGFASCAVQIGQTLWAGKDIPDGPRADPTNVKAAGDWALAQAGHYLGGCFSYGGESYWGLDRIHYLETRLQELGLGAAQQPIIPELTPRYPDSPGQKIEFFFSFRSPYSYLAFDRVRKLARISRAQLVLRPVLPMLMRGLPVPSAKSAYILRDCSREARQIGIPFGRICDPLGAGVERGYALLGHAEAQGRLAEYCGAFMTAVWSRGLDASTDAGLAKIVEGSGLNWEQAQTHLSRNQWRSRIEENQKRLQQIGLWGVPSFRVGQHSVWGQDRLWVIEDALRKSAEES